MVDITQSKKKTTEDKTKPDYLLLVKLLVLYTIVEISALFIASMLLHQPIPFASKTTASVNSGVGTVVVFLVMIILSAIILVLCFKYVKSRLVYKVISFATVFLTLSVSCYAIGYWAFGSMVLAMMFSFIISTTCALIFISYEGFHNTLVAASCVGAAAILGLTIPPLYAMLLLLLVAVYDFAAVFITKHMRTLAKGVIDERMPYFIALRGEKRGLMLGTGDIVLPILVAVAFFFVNPIMGAVLVLSNLAAIGLMFAVLQLKGKVMLPAIPFFAFTSVVAMAIGYMAHLWRF